MATLLLNNVPDEVLEVLNALARRDAVPVEEEAIKVLRNYADSQATEEGMIPRENLLAEAERLHRKMAARGVCLTEEQINSAIKEARR